ncbi:MAG: MaoC family dehydratase [Myxococcales bacterium]|nr:MaoC family dehydratase [Myxococcales bacterium]
MSEPHVVDGIEGLRALLGVELGPTTPLHIDQAMVDAFADVTRDHQFIHVDPERAAREGPFGGTVAHGYLVLGLVPPLLFERLLRVQGMGAALNYGVDRLRFPAVTRVGAELTLRAVLTELEPKGPGHLARFELTFETTDADRPCCVAQILVMFLPRAEPPPG